MSRVLALLVLLTVSACTRDLRVQDSDGSILDAGPSAADDGGLELFDAPDGGGELFDAGEIVGLDGPSDPDTGLTRDAGAER